MNEKWNRQRELYHRGFGVFITKNIFKPEEWLSLEDAKEYKILKENNV